MPHWLNEGLAQIFEAGQVEADSLRIDAPDRTRLTQLQDDLQSERPLTIQEVLLADEQEFLNPASNRSAQRSLCTPGAWRIIWPSSGTACVRRSWMRS